MSDMRARFAAHLAGDGIDVGPGHQPFPMPPSVTRVRLVDRWQPAENEALFAELDHPRFPAPDIVANLDTDRLGAIPDRSLDFVVASHVLEHVADPISQLHEMRRVLRRGGVALILLPDRTRTFDQGRPGTTLDHLIAEHRAGVTEVDDDHILEVLRHDRGPSWTPDPTTIGDEYDYHRRRSVHAHCWTAEEFRPVIEHVSGRPRRWTIVDEGAEGIEFGFVLRRRW